MHFVTILELTVLQLGQAHCPSDNACVVEENEADESVRLFTSAKLCEDSFFSIFCVLSINCPKPYKIYEAIKEMIEPNTIVRIPPNTLAPSTVPA